MVTIPKTVKLKAYFEQSLSVISAHGRPCIPNQLHLKLKPCSVGLTFYLVRMKNTTRSIMFHAMLKSNNKQQQEVVVDGN